MTSEQLVLQRVRNRVIDMLDWLVACEAAPPELGLDELVNCWEDWVPSPLPEGYFPEPVFSLSEEKLIRSVSTAVVAFCDATPGSIQDDAAALDLPQWASVVAAAKPALAEMMKRGRMPEEEDLSF